MIFESFGPENLVVTRALVERHGQLIDVNIGSRVRLWQEISTEYQYVAMTRAAAEACAAAKVAKYQKTVSVWDDAAQYFFREISALVADVKLVEGDSGLWSVTVSVAERQEWVVASLETVQWLAIDPAEYDNPAPGAVNTLEATVVQVSASETVVRVKTDIAPFDVHGVAAIKDGVGGVIKVIYAGTGDGGAVYTVAALPPFRLTYGAYVSNEV
jgi:hypothetical protein